MDAFYTVLISLLFISIGYCYGSILFGAIFAKIIKKNIREMGSGSIGGTNVSRTLGPGWGAATMILDATKTYLSVVTCWAIYIFTINKWYPENHALYSLIYLGGVASVFAHCFPIQYFSSLFFNHFDKKQAKNKTGGKGMACTGGLFFSISPWLGLSIFAIWLVTFLITHYVSVGSITCSVSACPLVFIKEIDLLYMFDNGIFNNTHNFIAIAPYTEHIWLFVSLFILLLSCAILIVIRHKDNIKRLRNGVESYLPFTKKQAEKHAKKSK